MMEGMNTREDHDDDDDDHQSDEWILNKKF